MVKPSKSKKQNNKKTNCLKSKKYRRERDLIRDVLTMLQQRGIFAWRNNTGAVKQSSRFIRFGVKGSADIIGILPPEGKFLAIECKGRWRKPTEEQLQFIAEIKKRGGIAGVCWSLADVERLLKESQPSADLVR